MAKAKRTLRLLTIICLFIFRCLTAYAGESADKAAEIIINEYYPALSAETADKINEIANSAGSDNDKILAMCTLLDKHSVYYPYGIPTATKQQKENVEYFVAQRLYIKINHFAYGADKDIALLIEANPDKPILLDLSDCSGGITTVMESIARTMVPKGLIYKVQFKDNEQQFFSEIEGPYRTVIVVTSRNTASCAEILVSALQDSGVGFVIGEPTSGKTSVQNIRVLPNGGTLKITVGNWLTRNGVRISESGIEPDLTLNRKFVNLLILIWGCNNDGFII